MNHDDDNDDEDDNEDEYGYNDDLDPDENDNGEEMIYNNVIWGVESPENKIKMNRNICYSNIIGPYAELKKLAVTHPTFLSWFRLASYCGIDVNVANEYLENVVKVLIPNKLKNHFQFVPLTEERINTATGLPSERGNIPWIELRVDVSKVSINNTFIMLNLLRFPQESPSSIIAMNKYRDFYPVDVALLLGLAECHQNYNHSFIGICSIPFVCDGVRPGSLKTWSFKKIWNDMKKEPPILKSCNKTFHMEKYFLKAISDLPSWEEKLFRGKKGTIAYLAEVGYNGTKV